MNEKYAAEKSVIIFEYLGDMILKSSTKNSQKVNPVGGFYRFMPSH
jgi:hypothetical protein